MHQIVEQTKEQKIAMYMKLNKKQLAEMLAEMLVQSNLMVDCLIKEKYGRPTISPFSPGTLTHTPTPGCTCKKSSTGFIGCDGNCQYF